MAEVEFLGELPKEDKIEYIGSLDSEPSYNDLPQSMSGTQKFLTGMGKGMMDIGTGALQRVLEGGEVIRNMTGTPSNQANIDRLASIVEQNNKVYKPLSDQSTAANVGNFIGGVAPILPIPGGVAGNALRRVGTSALAGGAVGALQPTTQNDSATDNALAGAATGGAMSGVLSGGSKIINAIKDKNPALHQAVMDKFGQVSQTLGEISNSPTIQKAETWLESLPGFLGINAFRRKQHEEATNLVKNHFAQYVIDPSQQTTAAIKESNKKYIDNLYNKFRENFKELPPVEATNTRQTALSMLDEYPDVFESIQNKKVKNLLNNIKTDTSGRKVSKLTRTPDGRVLFTNKEKFTLDDLWNLRKSIGAEIGSAKDDIAKGEYSKLYAAVSKDMDDLLDHGAGTKAVEAFKEANNAFKQYSAKFDVMREAYDQAMGTVGAKEMFSPKSYATALKTLANDPKKYPNIKWSQDEIDNMTGVANLLQVVKRSGQYMENPPTGARWGVPQVAALAGGGYISLPGTAATLSLTTLTKFLTTTEYGKKLALAASKIEPDNKNMKVIMQLIYNQVPKMASSGATRDF